MVFQQMILSVSSRDLNFFRQRSCEVVRYGERIVAFIFVAARYTRILAKEDVEALATHKKWFEHEGRCEHYHDRMFVSSNLSKSFLKADKTSMLNRNFDFYQFIVFCSPKAVNITFKGA